MKIRDIIVEAQSVYADEKVNQHRGVNYGHAPDLDKDQAAGMGRLDRFHHPSQADKTHTQYRMMMATAESNGEKNQELTTDATSWAGVDNFALPYTDVEAAMLDRAYDHLGIPAKRNITGDKRRHERTETNRVSPVRVRKS